MNKEKFQKYKSTNGFRYQMTPYCVFCDRKTDRMMEYSYHGVELDEKKFRIPVHPSCYLKKKTAIWLGVVFLFIAIFFGSTLLESLLFDAVPFWLLFLNCLPGITAAGYWGLRWFSDFEHEIARYKRSHTDYEDHYKSDHRRRAGFTNW